MSKSRPRQNRAATENQSREASASGISRVAQLRWLLVHPAVRSIGLGRTLLTEAVAFSASRSTN